MQWSEVRELYPNRWVLVEAAHSRIEGGKQYVDEVVVIRPLNDDREAKKALMKCKGSTFVYHTTNSEIVIEIMRNPLLRVPNAN